MSYVFFQYFAYLIINILCGVIRRMRFVWCLPFRKYFEYVINVQDENEGVFCDIPKSIEFLMWTILTIMYIPHFRSLPYNWKTPETYAITFVVQIANLFVALTLYVIIFTFFTGFCHLAKAFVKDVKDSLREINIEIGALGKDYPREIPLLHRAVLREKLCNIMRLQADSRELSVFLLILFDDNLTFIARQWPLQIQNSMLIIFNLHFRLVHEFSEFFSVNIAPFFLACGLFISIHLLKLNMVRSCSMQ